MPAATPARRCPIQLPALPRVVPTSLAPADHKRCFAARRRRAILMDQRVDVPAWMTVHEVEHGR
jgi:hypothetical protein